MSSTIRLNSKPPTPVVPWWRVGRPSPVEQKRMEAAIVLEEVAEAVAEADASLRAGIGGETLRDILRNVAAAHGFEPGLLRGQNRTWVVVHARHHFCYEAYHTGRYSMPQIGRVINRDHTTVVHAIRAHARRNNLPSLLAGDPDFKRREPAADLDQLGLAPRVGDEQGGKALDAGLHRLHLAADGADVGAALAQLAAHGTPGDQRRHEE
jgi:hypothetical protein